MLLNSACVQTGVEVQGGEHDEGLSYLENMGYDEDDIVDEVTVGVKQSSLIEGPPAKNDVDELLAMANLPRLVAEKSALKYKKNANRLFELSQDTSTTGRFAVKKELGRIDKAKVRSTRCIHCLC